MLRKFRVKINEKEYVVEMEEIGGQPVATPVAAPVAPQAPVVEATPAQAPVAPSAPQVLGEGETITAPMPGTILDVFVKVNDQVQVDQPLVILEAMKMENEIVSPISGTVTSVMVTKNQAIDVGEVIVSIQ